MLKSIPTGDVCYILTSLVSRVKTADQMDYNVSIYVEVSDTLTLKKMTYYSVDGLS